MNNPNGSTLNNIGSTLGNIGSNIASNLSNRSSETQSHSQSDAIQGTIPGMSSRIESGIGQMTDRVLNLILDRMSSNNFRDKLNTSVINPLTAEINQRIRPYLYGLAILYILLFIMLIYIIYLLLKISKAKIFAR